MLRPFLTLAKLLAVLVVLFFSGTHRIPAILYLGFSWCVWLEFVVRGWKPRLFAALGFALMALGWWFCFSLWGHFAEQVMASHTKESGRYWGRLANMSFWEGFGMALAGIFLLTCTDYLRPPKAKPEAGLMNEVDSDEGQVWPPAPKQPH